MKTKTFPLLLTLGSLLFLSTPAPADQLLTGTYTPGDDAVGTGNGPFVLTATVTPATDSFVTFTPDNQTYTFADLTNLNAVFTSATGAGGGSPRLSVELTNGTEDAFIHILLGTSPSFTDDATGLNAYSGVNLIGNNDAGRYDTSQFTGGNPFTTYSSALSLLGSYRVKEIDFVVDTFGSFGDRSIVLDSINASVPEPSSTALVIIAASLFGIICIYRSKATRRVDAEC